jgi:hypothetical protein
VGVGARVLVLLSCAVLLGSGGCTSDAELAEASFSAEHEDARARVWIPINEPRSIGTYRVDVSWSDGTSDRAEGQRDGMVASVWLADLTGDDAPEAVVAVSSAGSGTYGSVHVYGRRGDELSRLQVGALTDSQSVGYMGHDVFSIGDGRLWRSYPIYREGDTNAAPSGGEARFWYSFSDGRWVADDEDADLGNAVWRCEF